MSRCARHMCCTYKPVFPRVLTCRILPCVHTHIHSTYTWTDTHVCACKCAPWTRAHVCRRPVCPHTEVQNTSV